MKTLREELEEHLKYLENECDCDCCLQTREVLTAILSRHPEDEPLAVVAARKGWWLARARHYPDRWVLNFDSLNANYYGPLDKPIVAPTYAEAEAKARQYLESLPDKEGK